MVRLVFRPYTQIRRSICTSEPLRASTRVSSGFTLFRYSSPSFGSQQLCSYSNPSEHFQVGRLCTLAGSNLLLSFRAGVFHPYTRIDVRLLGPCFKTGGLQPLRQHPYCCGPRAGEEPESKTYNAQPRGLYYIDCSLSLPPTRCWPGQKAVSGCKPFPFNNFTYCFTLFSKCFSSFHYCTCSLSVSRRYLALDGIYHPLRAAFPNNSTRRWAEAAPAQTATGLSPSQAPCSKGLGCALAPGPATSRLQLAAAIPKLSSCRFTRRY